MEGNFLITAIEEVIEWLIETGLMDVLGGIITDCSVGAFYALLVTMVGVLTSVVTWGVGLVVLIVVAIAIVLVWLFIYVFHSVGLMRIAKKLEVKHRWMAWIPFANAYLLGACAEKSQTRNEKKPWKWSLILLFVTLGMSVGQPVVQLVISIVLSVLPMLSFVINAILESSTLILIAMNGYCLYLVFKEFLGKTGGIVMAVCSAVTIWFEGIFLFVVACFKVRPAQEPAKQEDDIAAVIEAE